MLKLRKVFVIALLLSTTTACQSTTTTFNSETSSAICEEWRNALFLPSRLDTEDTARGLTKLRAKQAAACEGIGDGF